MFFGNQKIQQILNNAVEGNFSHAYLIYGASHLGKRSLAEEFAKKLIGDENIFHPDIFILDGAGEFAGIENIREMRKKIALSPQSANKKVVLALDIDKIKQESLNAFLKSLEEPLPNVIFILTASSAVLKTIESRCFIVRCFPLSQKNMENHFGTDGDYAFNLGKPGILIESKKKSDKIACLSEILKTNISARFSLVEQIYKDMEKIEIMLYNWIGETRKILAGEKDDRKIFKAAHILKELIETFDKIFKEGMSPRVVLENLLLNI